ncbi:ComEC/Rec2 family competence protein [Haloarcula rubripromontorii]|uniref:ComEC/Rec2 family competence protein n=1 Tax=Haloarcula rubripromontorii TaxID=1705562 RepID=UPI00345C002A
MYTDHVLSTAVVAETSEGYNVVIGENPNGDGHIALYILGSTIIGATSVETVEDTIEREKEDEQSDEELTDEEEIDDAPGTEQDWRLSEREKLWIRTVGDFALDVYKASNIYDQYSDDDDDDNTTDPDPEVTFFDVGKGSSVLFEGPEENILIDAGSSAGASQANYVEAVENELNDDNGEATLHHVVVSHNDTDHIGYVDDLMDSDDVEVRNLYFSGIDAGNLGEDGVDREFDSSEMNSYIIDEAGASRQITDAGLTVRVTRPDTTNIDGVSTSDINANSLITRVKYDDQTFLMPGDIPAPVEEWMVSESDIDLTSRRASSTAPRDSRGRRRRIQQDIQRQTRIRRDSRHPKPEHCHQF